jgi:4-amino-4-deoxy-L-arabinose transferase-like glycosyltransferase
LFAKPEFKQFKIAFAFIFVYAIAHLYLHWQSPLGLTPVLDGAENVLLADRIFSGTLPNEPFYRAMLYPAYLAVFRFLGFAVEDLHSLAAISGVFFHFLNSILVAFITWKLWKNWRSALAAMLIYGLYPPALFFAVDPLDITMALFFLSLYFALLFEGIDRQKSFLFFIAGLALGVGTVLRANILPAAAASFYLLFKKDQRKHGVITLLALLLPILAGAGVNFLHSGQFRLLPWQGAFNLYSANHADANGKYFQQTIILPDRDLGRNPARMESEILYFKQTGKAAPYEIDAFNRHWRQKTFASISQHPMKFLKLSGKKIYYLFNNFEQYNNKTFAFHKQQSPVLRYNPLCFGLILILAALTLINHADTDTKKQNLLLTAMLFLALGILAFYVSARFRILLIPGLIASAGGFFSLRIDQIRSKQNLALAILLAFITFSGFFNAADLSTFNSDRLLLAHASARLRMDNEVINWTNSVLKEQPDNIIAMRLKIVSFTNLALSGKFSDEKAWSQVTDELEYLERMQIHFADTLFLAGCKAFRIDNDIEQAGKFWQQGLEKSEQKDLFIAVMIMTKLRPADHSLLEPAQNSPILWYALVISGLAEKEDSNRYRTNARAIKFLLGLRED